MNNPYSSDEYQPQVRHMQPQERQMISYPQVETVSPFARTMRGVRQRVSEITNGLTYGALWATLGAGIGAVSATTVAPLLGLTLASLKVPALVGSIVGAIKGVMTGLRKSDEEKKAEYGQRLIKEEVVATRVSNYTADQRFQTTQLSNQNLRLANMSLSREVDLQANYDPEMLMMDRRIKELELQSMETSVPYQSDNVVEMYPPSSRPNNVVQMRPPLSQPNHFAELDQSMRA